MIGFTMRDPTAETAATQRDRIPPSVDLAESTVGLLCISKERSEEFLDHVEAKLSNRGIKVLRYAKPTHTAPAPESTIQDIVENCDVVVEGLAD